MFEFVNLFVSESEDSGLAGHRPVWRRRAGDREDEAEVVDMKLEMKLEMKSKLESNAKMCCLALAVVRQTRCKQCKYYILQSRR